MGSLYRSEQKEGRQLCTYFYTNHEVNCRTCVYSVSMPAACSWRAEHGEPPTEAAVWDLYRLEQKSIAASTQRLERAEAESTGDAPIPPSMVRK